MKFNPDHFLRRGFFCLLFSMLLSFFAFAQMGKDGVKTISATSSINEYTTLSADAFSGSTSISVANSSLNANGLFSSSLAAGDLILIIQIQGASIIYPDDSTYGGITS